MVDKPNRGRDFSLLKQLLSILQMPPCASEPKTSSFGKLPCSLQRALQHLAEADDCVLFRAGKVRTQNVVPARSLAKVVLVSEI